MVINKRATCDLTVADRLALYDHVTQETLRAKTEAANNEDLYVDLVAKLKKGLLLMILLIGVWFSVDR